MIKIVGGLLLIALSLSVLALQNLYHSVPTKELKRLARRGDALATKLYRPLAYGESLRTGLLLLGFISMSFGLLLTLPGLPAVVSFVVIAALLAWILIGLPMVRVSPRNAWLAAAMAAPLAKALYYLHPVLDRFSVVYRNHGQPLSQNDIYEREDLLGFIEAQKKEIGNRIDPDELDMAGRALLFHSKQVSDILKTQSKSYMVNADDSIGPLLLDQLHKNGQNQYLVYKDKQDNIIGSLSMNDALSAKEGGRVIDLVKNDLIYLREDFSLVQVISAFQKTGKRLAVVVNKFEDCLGIVSLEDAIQDLVGEVKDGLDDYESRSSVAAFQPQLSEPVPEEVPSEDGTSPEETEVVE